MSMNSNDKSLTIVLVVLILTVGGCMTNAVHQEELTKQMRITHDCGEVSP